DPILRIYGSCRLLKGMRLLLVKAFKPRMGDFYQHPTVRNLYETPCESQRGSVEAKSARPSERPQKGWHRYVC
nr:hypothetical protein [Tanacetum cinerariifolium]